MRITIFGDPLIGLPHVDSYIARVKGLAPPIERAHINEKWPRFPANGAAGKLAVICTFFWPMTPVRRGYSRSDLRRIVYLVPYDPACGQLIRAYEEFGKGVLGVKQVSPEAIHKYSSLHVTPIRDNLFNCDDMVEKPAPDQVLSLYSILGRCILPPEIFDILDQTAPGAGGEIQLTDAMRTLARRDGMTAVDFVGKRYDMGNKLGIMQASVEIALNHPTIGKEFRAYLKEICKTL